VSSQYHELDTHRLSSFTTFDVRLLSKTREVRVYIYKYTHTYNYKFICIYVCVYTYLRSFVSKLLKKHIYVG